MVELKRVPPAHRTLERAREDGLEQLCEHLDRQGEREGWLLISDRRAGRRWERRLWREDLELEGRRLWSRGG